MRAVPHSTRYEPSEHSYMYGGSYRDGAYSSYDELPDRGYEAVNIMEVEP